MILIVGLGNPGEKYEDTRHNVGFMVLDLLLKKLTPVENSIWEENKKFNSFFSRIGKDIILAKPASYMNASGEVINKLMMFYKVHSLGLYVVHDDLDLPLGKMKISYGHGSAGHKGVKSLIEKIGSNDFVRVRVGIGSNKRVSNPERYVLSDFEEREEPKLRKAVKRAVEAVEMILEKGVEKAASRFN